MLQFASVLTFILTKYNTTKMLTILLSLPSGKHYDDKCYRWKKVKMIKLAFFLEIYFATTMFMDSLNIIIY